MVPRRLTTRPLLSYEAPQGQLEAQSRDQGQDEIVRLLLAANAPVEVAPDGNMPLHIASGCGHAGVVSLLLAAGAAVNTLQDLDGDAPLHLACREGQAEVARVLLAAAPTPTRSTPGTAERLSSSLCSTERPRLSTSS